MDYDRRRGAGLPALLVGVALVAVLTGAIYQVLVTNRRIVTVQRKQLLDQQALSTGIDLLAQELREVSAVGGDLTMLGSQMVAFRAFRAFGLTCEVLSDGPVSLRVAYQGARFKMGDQVYLFVDGDPEISGDDHWRPFEVAEAQAGQRCGEDGIDAQELRLSDPGLSALEGRIHRGAVVRSWEEVQYAVGRVRGQPYLTREENGHRSPLVGPLAERNGFELRYMDVDGNPTMALTEVATVRITLRTQRDQEAGLGPVGDSLTTSVFLRN